MKIWKGVADHVSETGMTEFDSVSMFCTYLDTPAGLSFTVLIVIPGAWDSDLKSDHWRHFEVGSYVLMETFNTNVMAVMYVGLESTFFFDAVLTVVRHSRLFRDESRNLGTRGVEKWMECTISMNRMIGAATKRPVIKLKQRSRDHFVFILSHGNWMKFHLRARKGNPRGSVGGWKTIPLFISWINIYEVAGFFFGLCVAHVPCDFSRRRGTPRSGWVSSGGTRSTATGRRPRRVGGVIARLRNRRLSYSPKVKSQLIAATREDGLVSTWRMITSGTHAPAPFGAR